jgi:opacity protein-like surface antigen
MTSKTAKFSTAFALSAIILSPSALFAAEGDQYFGIQYASTIFEIDGVSDDWSPAVVIAQYGKYLSENFALEGRIGTDAGSDTRNFSGPGGSIDIEVEIDSLFGIYGVGHHVINNNSSVYALIGISRGKASITITGTFPDSGDESKTDMSYGVGAKIGISDTAGINLEYISYLSESDFDVSAVSLGFVAKF